MRPEPMPAYLRRSAGPADGSVVASRRHRTTSSSSTTPRAFTLTEIMVVVGVIIVLLALLLPALNVARKNSQWAGSQSNLRQIFTLMTAYSTDNRELIVPSQFDYSTSSYPGKVRSPSPAGVNPLIGMPHQGTWTDILWTTGGFPPIRGVPDTEYDYRFDSPDRLVFENIPNFDSIFRSKVENTRNAPENALDPSPEATPFGSGAREQGMPGYFAANQFFDSTDGDWWTQGQITRPTLSVYLVDSFYGEVIPDDLAAWDSTIDPESPSHDVEVDFRYPGETVLLLMLDGRTVTQGRWGTLQDLQKNHQIRVRSLDTLN